MAKNSFAVWKTPFWARHLPSKILGCSTSTVSVFSFHFHRASQTNVKVHRQWSTRSALCPSFVACCGRPPVLTLKAQYAAQGTEPTAANRRSEINNVAAGRLCREKKRNLSARQLMCNQLFLCVFLLTVPPTLQKKKKNIFFFSSYGRIRFFCREAIFTTCAICHPLVVLKLTSALIRFLTSLWLQRKNF